MENREYLSPTIASVGPTAQVGVAFVFILFLELVVM